MRRADLVEDPQRVQAVLGRENNEDVLFQPTLQKVADCWFVVD
jgi:hypothetical protein